MVHEAQQRKASILDELTSARTSSRAQDRGVALLEKDHRGRLRIHLRAARRVERTAVDRPRTRPRVTRRTTHSSPDVSHFRGVGHLPHPCELWVGFVPLWCVRVVAALADPYLCAGLHLPATRHRRRNEDQGWLPRESWPRPSRLSRRPAGREQHPLRPNRRLRPKKAATAAKGRAQPEATTAKKAAPAAKKAAPAKKAATANKAAPAKKAATAKKAAPAAPAKAQAPSGQKKVAPAKVARRRSPRRRRNQISGRPRGRDTVDRHSRTEGHPGRDRRTSPSCRPRSTKRSPDRRPHA